MNNSRLTIGQIESTPSGRKALMFSRARRILDNPNAVAVYPIGAILAAARIVLAAERRLPKMPSDDPYKGTRNAAVAKRPTSPPLPEPGERIDAAGWAIRD